MIVFTAAVHSLLDAYPEYQIAVESKHQALLQFDPRLSAGGQKLSIDYVDYMDDGSNYAEAYCKDLAAKLNLPLTLTCEPKLYLTDEERDNPYPGLPDKYVVFNAGSKPDMPIKQIPIETAEQVVESLDLPCVQVGKPQHNHPIKGSIDLRGKTTLRDVMRIAYHAQAGWGGDTMLSHTCCSLGTPYVCCASGRSPDNWLRIYKNMRLLSEPIECAPCRMRRLEPLGDSFDKLLCKKPRFDFRLPVAECMVRITAEKIVEAVKELL